MNAKNSVFVICTETIIYLLLYICMTVIIYLHDYYIFALRKAPNRIQILFRTLYDSCKQQFFIVGA